MFCYSEAVTLLVYMDICMLEYVGDVHEMWDGSLGWKLAIDNGVG